MLCNTQSLYHSHTDHIFHPAPPCWYLLWATPHSRTWPPCSAPPPWPAYHQSPDGIAMQPPLPLPPDRSTGSL